MAHQISVIMLPFLAGNTGKPKSSLEEGFQTQGILTKLDTECHFVPHGINMTGLLFSDHYYENSRAVHTLVSTERVFSYASPEFLSSDYSQRASVVRNWVTLYLDFVVQFLGCNFFPFQICVSISFHFRMAEGPLGDLPSPLPSDSEIERVITHGGHLLIDSGTEMDVAVSASPDESTSFQVLRPGPVFPSASSDEGGQSDEDRGLSLPVSLNLDQVADALNQVAVSVPPSTNLLVLEGKPTCHLNSAVEVRASQLPSSRTSPIEKYHNLMLAFFASGCRCPVDECRWEVVLGTKADPLVVPRDDAGRVLLLPDEFKVTPKYIFTHWEMNHFAAGVLEQFKVPCPYVDSKGRQCESHTGTKRSALERHLRDVHLIGNKELLASFNCSQLCKNVRDNLKGDRAQIPPLCLLKLSVSFKRGREIRSGKVINRLLLETSDQTASVEPPSPMAPPPRPSGAAKRKRQRSRTPKQKGTDRASPATGPFSVQKSTDRATPATGPSGAATEPHPRDSRSLTRRDADSRDKREHTRSSSTTIRDCSVELGPLPDQDDWATQVSKHEAREARKSRHTDKRAKGDLNPSKHGATPVNLDTPSSRAGTSHPTGTKRAKLDASSGDRSREVKRSYYRAKDSVNALKEAAGEVHLESRRSICLLPKTFSDPASYTIDHHHLSPWEEMIQLRMYGRELLTGYSKVQSDLAKLIEQYDCSRPDDDHWSDDVWGLAHVLEVAERNSVPLNPEFRANLRAVVTSALEPRTTPVVPPPANPESVDPLVQPPDYHQLGARLQSNAPSAAAASGQVAVDDIVPGEPLESAVKPTYAEAVRAVVLPPAPAPPSGESAPGNMTVLGQPMPRFIIPRVPAPVTLVQASRPVVSSTLSSTAGSTRTTMSGAQASPHVYDLGRPLVRYQPPHRAVGYRAGDTSALRAENSHLVLLPIEDAREMALSMARMLDAFCSGTRASAYGDEGVAIARKHPHVRPPP